MSKNTTIKDWLVSTDIPYSVIAKKVGVSNKTVYNWSKNKTLSNKATHILKQYYNEVREREDRSVQSEERIMLIESQQNTILLQKDKIKRLEEDLVEIKNILNNATPESSHWDDLSYHYTTEVELHWKSFNLLGRTICSVSNLKEQSKILGYSESKLKDMWDIGTKYNDMSKHPIDKILHQDSKDELEDIAKTLPTVFNAIKDMIGNHYIPTKLMYKCKDGSYVGAISYNKINWRNQKVSSKIAFLIEE